jgi:hypothetical protein
MVPTELLFADQHGTEYRLSAEGKWSSQDKAPLAAFTEYSDLVLEEATPDQGEPTRVLAAAMKAAFGLTLKTVIPVDEQGKVY